MRRISAGAILVTAAFLLPGSGSPLFALAVGDKAPDFTLPATTQEKWSSSELIGKKNFVLFSFIGAFTPT